MCLAAVGMGTMMIGALNVGRVACMSSVNMGPRARTEWYLKS